MQRDNKEILIYVFNANIFLVKILNYIWKHIAR